MTRPDYPVINAQSLFPCRHPSVWMALGLSLGSIPLGPLLCVPASHLARLVRREILDHRGRLTGGGVAVAAEAIAWSSGAAWALLVLTLLIAAWPSTTYGVAPLGLVLGAGIYFRRGRRLPAVASAVLGLLAVVFGLSLHNILLRERAVEQIHECERARLSAAAAWRDRQLESAKEAYRRISGVCPKEHVYEADSRLKSIVAQEDIARLTEDEKARRWSATQEAQSLAWNQRDASIVRSHFASAEQRIAAGISEAHRHERAKRWDKALQSVRSIQAEMAPFKKTEIESSPRWNEISIAVEELEKTLQPELDKIYAQQDASRRRKAEAAARRESSSKRVPTVEHLRPSNRVQCCDGSYSPTCTYGGSLRGCCSHHGGVC